MKALLILLIIVAVIQCAPHKKALKSPVRLIVQERQNAVNCTFTDPATGNKFNLTPLRNNQEDYFLARNETGEWNVWINVCRPLITRVCGTNDVAGCQQWASNGFAALGRESTAKWEASPTEDGVDITYTQGDDGRSFQIRFRCGPDAGAPVYLTEDPELFYNFAWKTQYACSTR